MSDDAIIRSPDWLAGLDNLSEENLEVALRRPLAELVLMTLAGAGSYYSKSTTLGFQVSICLFLQFLGSQLSDQLPTDWRPLVESVREGRKKVWKIRGLTAVLRAVSADVIDDFTTWRVVEGDGRPAQALRRRAVNFFLREAFREGILTHEQAQNIGLRPYPNRNRNKERPAGRHLKPEEVRRLRECVTQRARNDNKAARDRAILDLMLFAGLQRGETASLRTDNFEQDSGRWWLILRGMGGIVRRLKVHPILYKSLVAWLKIANMALSVGSVPLFYNMTRNGKPTGITLNPSVIGYIVAEYGALADLAPRNNENCLKTRDLRLTCARNAYDNGASLLQIQYMLGHKDVKTTMRYIGALDNEDDTAVDHVRYTNR